MSRHCFPYPRFVLLLGLALSLLSLSTWVTTDAQAAASYSFTILDAPGATSTYPASINASGQVAGYYQDSSGQHGFIATPMGTPTDIPTLSEWATLGLTALLLGISGWWLRRRKLF